MDQAIKKSLIFWLTVFSVLIVLPSFLVLINVGLEGYIKIFSILFLIVFGPGVPIYLIFKGSRFMLRTKNAPNVNIGRLFMGLAVMLITTLVWLWLVIETWLFPISGGAGVLGYILLPLLMFGAIGEILAKSAFNN